MLVVNLRPIRVMMHVEVYIRNSFYCVSCTSISVICFTVISECVRNRGLHLLSRMYHGEVTPHLRFSVLCVTEANLLKFVRLSLFRILTTS
jgi:hypothetical protein